MFYLNNDPVAISVMEVARTGNYGEHDCEDSSLICPVCGEETDELYKNTFTDEIVGCADCIEKTYEKSN